MIKSQTTVALMTAAALSAICTPIAAAQNSSAIGQAAAQTCVGVWDGAVQIGPVTRTLLVAFTEEGIIHVAEAAAQGSSVPGGADVEFNSPGLGAWRDTSQGCSMIAKVLSNDSQGVDSGFATISGALQLDADRNTISGTVSLRTTLPGHEQR